MDVWYVGVLAFREQVLMVRAKTAEGAGKWSLPREFVRHGEKEDDAIILTLRQDTGFETVPNRFLYETEPTGDGSLTRCYLLVFDRAEGAPRDAADLNVALTNGSPTREYRWFPLGKAREDPEVARAIPLLACKVDNWPAAHPHNWVSIPDKERELEHRTRRAQRYFTIPEPPEPEPDPLYQALFKIADHIPERHGLVWDFVRRFGGHPSERVRVALAVCLLEDLLRDHFDRIFPKVELLAGQDPAFADCFWHCWDVGQASLPGNLERFRALQARLGRNPE
ncbi:MAG: NUDIX domain-containing protein [Candidatus Coatesbacteria bacterium]